VEIFFSLKKKKKKKEEEERKKKMSYVQSTDFNFTNQVEKISSNLV
jgi:hypothetical protein